MAIKIPQKQIYVARMSAASSYAQAGGTYDTVTNWTLEDINVGNISGTATGFTVAAGNAGVYRVEVYIQLSGANLISGEFLELKLYDITGASYLSSPETQHRVTAGTNEQPTMRLVKFIEVPATENTYQIRFRSNQSHDGGNPLSLGASTVSLLAVEKIDF